MNVLSIFKRDLLIAFRNRGELLNPLMFFFDDMNASFDTAAYVMANKDTAS